MKAAMSVVTFQILSSCVKVFGTAGLKILSLLILPWPLLWIQNVQGEALSTPGASRSFTSRHFGTTFGVSLRILFNESNESTYLVLSCQNSQPPFSDYRTPWIFSRKSYRKLNQNIQLDYFVRIICTCYLGSLICTPNIKVNWSVNYRLQCRYHGFSDVRFSNTDIQLFNPHSAFDKCCMLIQVNIARNVRNQNFQIECWFFPNLLDQTSLIACLNCIQVAQDN